MPRLIGVFAQCTVHFAGFVLLLLIFKLPFDSRYKGILHYVSCSFGFDYGIMHGTYIILVGRLIQNAHYKWRNIIT